MREKTKQTLYGQEGCILIQREYYVTKGGSTFAMSGQTEHISPALQRVKRNPALVKFGHVWHFTLAPFHPSPIPLHPLLNSCHVQKRKS